jgi:hypothetical protein
VLSDFFGKCLSETVGRADLVLSGGVIEHWDVDGQRRVLQTNIDLSNRWVLLTVPNLESPVFRSFVRWAKAVGRFYADEHYEISVPRLAEDAACEVALMDGCRLFLTRSAHYAAGDSELDDFYADLRSRLVAAGRPGLGGVRGDDRGADAIRLPPLLPPRPPSDELRWP